MAAMMRQICKQILTMTGAALLALSLAGGALAQSLVTTIVTDPLTGVAIDGYDPVSYFTEPQPLQGSPEFEYHWGGVPWYFASAANRDGYLSDGKPRIYVIEGMKLYLFYSAANREAFLLAPGEALDRAEQAWARLSPGLQDADATRPVSEPVVVEGNPGDTQPTAEHP
jgi:hypothetical protein